MKRRARRSAAPTTKEAPANDGGKGGGGGESVAATLPSTQNEQFAAAMAVFLDHARGNMKKEDLDYLKPIGRLEFGLVPGGDDDLQVEEYEGDEENEEEQAEEGEHSTSHGEAIVKRADVVAAYAGVEMEKAGYDRLKRLEAQRGGDNTPAQAARIRKAETQYKKALTTLQEKKQGFYRCDVQDIPAAEECFALFERQMALCGPLLWSLARTCRGLKAIVEEDSWARVIAQGWAWQRARVQHAELVKGTELVDGARSWHRRQNPKGPSVLRSILLLDQDAFYQVVVEGLASQRPLSRRASRYVQTLAEDHIDHLLYWSRMLALHRQAGGVAGESPEEATDWLMEAPCSSDDILVAAELLYNLRPLPGLSSSYKQRFNLPGADVVKPFAYINMDEEEKKATPEAMCDGSWCGGPLIFQGLLRLLRRAGVLEVEDKKVFILLWAELKHAAQALVTVAEEAVPMEKEDFRGLAEARIGNLLSKPLSVLIEGEDPIQTLATILQKEEEAKPFPYDEGEPLLGQRSKEVSRLFFDAEEAEVVLDSDGNVVPQEKVYLSDLEPYCVTVENVAIALLRDCRERGLFGSRGVETDHHFCVSSWHGGKLTVDHRPLLIDAQKWLRPIMKSAIIQYSIIGVPREVEPQARLLLRLIVEQDLRTLIHAGDIVRRYRVRQSKADAAAAGGQAQEDGDAEKREGELLASDLDLACDVLEDLNASENFGRCRKDLPYFYSGDRTRWCDWRKNKNHDAHTWGSELVGTSHRRGIRRIIAATVGAERVSRDDWVGALEHEIKEKSFGEQIDGSAERWLQKRAARVVMSVFFNMYRFDLGIASPFKNLRQLKRLQKIYKGGKVVKEVEVEDEEEEEEEEWEESGSSNGDAASRDASEDDDEDDEGTEGEEDNSEVEEEGEEDDSELEEEGEEDEEGQPRRRLHAVDLHKGLQLLEERTQDGEAAWFPLCGFRINPRLLH